MDGDVLVHVEIDIVFVDPVDVIESEVLVDLPPEFGKVDDFLDLRLALVGWELERGGSDLFFVSIEKREGIGGRFGGRSLGDISGFLVGACLNYRILKKSEYRI